MTDTGIILSAIIGCGFLLLVITLFWMKTAEIKYTDRKYREGIYSELLSAITMVMVSNDPPGKVKANHILAQKVHTVNLIAGQGVLSALKTLLELQNIPDSEEIKRKREHAALEDLVFSIRKETKREPVAVNRKETESIFKFYMPVHYTLPDTDSD
ncbi:MAG: hypothetical protein JXA44_06525 [Methanospirillaceae archaeon]|nr:hypothetical protein [Methanospirillaceae archaeon]